MRLTKLGALATLGLFACQGAADGPRVAATSSSLTQPCTIDQCPPPQSQTLTVPGDAPTIQAAIDQIGDGGTVRVRAGDYAEQLEVIGKHVAIVGAPVATLRSTDPQRPLVAYSRGGGGSLAELNLRPSGDGVVALADGQSPPSDVRLSDVTIHGGARGITGSFGALTLVHSDVVDMSGAGVFVDNTSGPAGCNVSFDHVEVRNNAGGGLAIVGGTCTAAITNSSFVHNAIFGVALDRAGSVHIAASSASATLADSAGLWGDGVVVVDSGPVLIEESTVSFAARAGLSSFGCSSVTLANDELLCDAIALDGESHGACSPTWSDAGGNVCGGCGSSETCQVLSNALAPPEAIPGP